MKLSTALILAMMIVLVDTKPITNNQTSTEATAVTTMQPTTIQQQPTTQPTQPQTRQPRRPDALRAIMEPFEKERLAKLIEGRWIMGAVIGCTVVFTLCMSVCAGYLEVKLSRPKMSHVHQVAIKIKELLHSGGEEGKKLSGGYFNLAFIHDDETPEQTLRD
ncbi:membrane protein ORF142A [Cyprinid herpesvirus 2]|nr:membrane protein ORF142A [Cyprinid herpesvirus 2]QIM55313.1 membrane protein [Cyprinid herpesvirus 2]